MKDYYIRDILGKTGPGEEVRVLGWVAAKRDMGTVVFIDIVDSTGTIQAVVEETSRADVLKKAREVSPECSIRVKGLTRRVSAKARLEVDVKELDVIGGAWLDVSPRPRSPFNPFDKKYVDLILRRRHLYLRNERMAAVLKVRDLLVHILRDWLRREGFTEIHAPILTQVPLYEDDTLFKLDFFGEEVYLTQCVAFYLESAVHAFEKVYSINPSFRAEKSKGRRYLAEFWHLKAEVGFADLPDTIALTEQMLAHTVRRLAEESQKELAVLGVDLNVAKTASTPYPCVTYAEALDRLARAGRPKEWGRSLGDRDVGQLSKAFETPFWVVGNPRTLEPFPYRTDASDPEITRTADLIATDGFGEVLGAAEKIWEPRQLAERLEEKGKADDGRYVWCRELRELGSIPHSGFGMGIERLIRWLLRLNHVRDAIAFPRLYGRSPYP